MRPATSMHGVGGLSPAAGRAVAAPPPRAAAPAAAAEGGRLKVSMVSLGCPKNTVDGEVLLGDLARAGFDVVDAGDVADAIVVNTCAFVEDAKNESIETVLEAARLKAGGAVRRVVVTGCLAQRYSDELAEQLPEADLVVGFQSYGTLAASLRQVLGAPPALGDDDEGGGGGGGAAAAQRVQVGDATVGFRPEADRHRLTPRHYAYLRVAEGCDHRCTFCAIPGFRGKFRSKSRAAILDEARRLVADGALELNLIAEDTNQWGSDRKDGTNLAGLLRELSALEGLRWIRILYAYPSYFTDDLVAEIAANPKVVKYIDMPLQHVSNLTLLAMNRPPAAHTRELLAKLRARIPGLALRTTFICGFPGETEEQHRELVDFCEDFKFERMGAFAYSEEDGTPAATMPDQVAPEAREARRDELVSLQQRLGEAWAAARLGDELDVLIDGVTEDGDLFGRTQWDAPDIDNICFVGAPEEGSGAAPAAVGEMRRCRVVGNSIFDLEVVPID